MSTQAAEHARDTITITLPDGSERTYPAGTTGLEVAASIGKRLAEDALAVIVDGKEKDLYLPLMQSASLAIITPQSAEGLEIIRHDAAHLLAHAVKELFPETQVTIGPTIEDGFFYDFYRPTPFSTDDLAAIEARMKEISARNLPIRREEWNRHEAIAFFEAQGEKYKAQIIRDLPESETISLYRQGEFIDLCRGPHAPSTSKVKHVKLLKVSGAYWRGDHRNEMLQRIYGTAWATEKDLQAYLTRIEEAEKRDHRKLGRELDLFHVQEEAAGMVFWHDKGWTVYRIIENLIRTKLRKNGYIEVRTPQVVDRSLWEASGHWEKFGEDMFYVKTEERTFAIKPMNCPCHVQIFNHGMKSYRELPIRMAEFGSCHRNEPSGSLHGIMRLRAFTQDDAHIFCAEDDITQETIAFCALLKEVYQIFGFEEVRVKFSDRPAKRAGTDSTWDKAEGALKTAIEAAGMPYVMNPGEGAFYGPKLEFVLRDAIGRDWQCGTLQVDFVLPERLDANYIAPDGSKQRPVMLHRAILGSLERFIGILIEQYSGRFPFWLAPVQVVVAGITNDVDDYVAEVVSTLEEAGIRAVADTSSNKINYKIREHSNAKVPVILAIGRKEAEDRTVSIRRLGSDGQRVVPLSDAVAQFIHEGTIPA